MSRAVQWSQRKSRRPAANTPPLCLPAEWTELWNSAKRSEVPGSSTTNLVLMDLRPVKTYNLRVFAVNSVGRSDDSNVLTYTTKEAGKAASCLTFWGEISLFLMESLLL